jgi:hypothetical protein
VLTIQKAIYYVAHLAPWFALCAAILLADSRRFSDEREIVNRALRCGAPCPLIALLRETQSV